MKSICVYAGSALGNNSEFTNKAIELGHAIADRSFSMVYGGGSKGLMGVTADAALSKDAEVTGIITKQLDAIEVGHKGLTKLEIVSSMHERKARMAEISDAIISLPGGVGTWEELFEALAWNQLGFYSKPIILFNVSGYYESLYQFSKDAVDNKADMGSTCSKDFKLVVVTPLVSGISILYAISNCSEFLFPIKKSPILLIENMEINATISAARILLNSKLDMIKDIYRFF